jgi:parvulin-like peptidyl-prolyl isomerase
MGDRRSIWQLALILFGLLAGCKKELSPTHDLPQASEMDPARTPALGPKQATVSLSQILVTHVGANNRSVQTKRSWHQAKVRAQYLTRLARSRKQTFADLAKRFSDDSASQQTGGDLGVVEQGHLHPAVERVAFRLGLGQVSDPVQSPDGFHVLFRHEAQEAQVSEIVITYTGAKKYTPRTERTRLEAKSLAQKIHSQLQTGADFADLALTFSDHPSWEKGGHLPIFRQGSQHPKLEEIIWPLPTPGLSSVIETPTGFHILARHKVKRIRVRVIEIQFRQAYAPIDDTRRQKAYNLAVDLYQQAIQAHADFASLGANQPATQPGIDIRRISPAQSNLPFEVEKAVFKLEIGQVSEPIETEVSYFLIKRTP